MLPPSPAARPPRAAPVAEFSLRAAAARLHPAGTARWLPQRLKFLLRACGQPRFTRAWLARLAQPDLAPLWIARPRLATKLQRPYVCSAWDTPERCAALFGHYAALPQLFSTEARTAIYLGGLDLLHLANSGSGRHLVLRLAYHDQFEKEGELTLELNDPATGLTLAGLTFCLASNGGELLAIIGGLQASPDPRTRGLIHDLAKEMHGLRPKALALWCLQALAAHWGVRQLQAVDDAHHIYRHWRKRRAFAASYDEFWLESDGRRLPGGGWELPLQLRERTREELKPTRRKAYERRYVMLAALRPQLLAAADALAPHAATRPAPTEFVYSDRAIKIQGAPALAPLLPAVLNHSF